MIAFLRRKQPKQEPLACQLARTLSRPKRMLFVDDNSTIRSYFTKWVPENFYVDVVCAASVEEARSCLAHGSFDVAILDYKLTNGNGVELYREISEASPKMRVIFLTGYDNTDLRRAVEAIGPARIYTKDSLGEPRFLEQLFAQIGVRKRNNNTTPAFALA